MPAPDNPPVVLPRRDFRVWASIHNAGYVFAITTASAPSVSATLAINPRDPIVGDSLTQSGRLQAVLAAETTPASSSGLVPYSAPPRSTLGQETFSSHAASPSVSSRTRITSTYSATVCPNTLAITAVSNLRSCGSFSATNARTPIFCSPMALIIPLGVSHMRGAGAPAIGCAERPFTTMPPRRFRSTSSANSIP